MDKISFTINGESYSLYGSDVKSDTSLNDYLRHHVNLRGTKAMCHEGGCGACIVSVSALHPVSKERNIFSVNSCLVSILSCHRWDITTIEGIGNRKDGYHQIQARLAAFNGTQCGFCTPGWVMNMYSLHQTKNHKTTMKEVENSFAGNICRCTGYRPILDAFKSLAVDVEKPLAHKVQDLEDLAQVGCLKKKPGCLVKCKSFDEEWCVIGEEDPKDQLCLQVKAARWYKVFTLRDVFKILEVEGYDSYRLIAGNTGQGVYHLNKPTRVSIDISSVENLRESSQDINLVLGAGMSLTEVMEIFQKYYTTKEEFKYLATLYQHLDLVAHIPVRNIGTIGGNLALKNQHNEFPSDVFLLLATVSATVTIVAKTMDQSELTMTEFLTADLNGKVILNVKLPPLSANYLLKTYKIMPRAQNAHALVNAGFLFKVNSSHIVEKATIVYGNIDPKFIYAKKTQGVMVGVDLFSQATLRTALSSLSTELVPEDGPLESAKFIKSLALNLFYKAIISLSPADKVDPRVKSGGDVFTRPLSKGTQTFDTDKALWPLNKPIPKLEALIQCSGEALYANDLPTAPREVHAAFVLSTVYSGDIDYFDAKAVLKSPGVVAFYTAKDIPGKNTFTPSSVPYQASDEEILCSGKVLYYGQPVGIIVANGELLANRAARLVKVHYKNVQQRKPVLTIRDALAAPKSENRVRLDDTHKPKEKGVNTTKVVKGSFEMKGQYHFTMEPQTCVVVPREGGELDVFSSTQWVDLIQVAVAQSLNLPEHIVNVLVRRVGGAYGGKASRSSLPATACALVAHKLNRPARLVMSLQTNMAAVGKRQNCLCNYEVEVNDDGLIQSLKAAFYQDCGACYNDSSSEDCLSTILNLYSTERWYVEANSVRTDKPTNTWCRAPGTAEGTAIVEHIMERISHALQKDVAEVKIINLAKTNSVLKDMILSFKDESEYSSRQRDILKFNGENRWRKRAIKLVTMSYPIGFSGNFGVTVSVFHADGTVAVSHAGIEMGQGINTKVAQVCAFILKIPLEKIAVKPTDSFTTPNAMATNGSLTSESVAFAAIKACKDLLERIEPAKEELENPKWEQIIKKAYDKGINLQSTYVTSEQDAIQGYSVYGVTIAEIELDVLTGSHQVLRVDILEDTGQSMSPEVDVGQIEGAFVMGLGLWTSENLIYDLNTGKLLTDRTWTYKPPGAKDIPLDFRINFRRNAPNPVGVLRAKATGEPALVMAVVVTHAIHEAVLAARKEYGYQDTEWLSIENPYSVSNILLAIAPKIEEYKLK